MITIARVITVSTAITDGSKVGSRTGPLAGNIVRNIQMMMKPSRLPAYPLVFLGLDDIGLLLRARWPESVMAQDKNIIHLLS
jgi:hypothetical protein